MNTEQLKMLLDALHGIGVEGKDAFVWWLVADKVVGPIAWLCTFAGLCYIALRIVRTFAPSPRDFGLDRAQAAYEAARNAWLWADGQESLDARPLYLAAEEYAKKRGLKV